MVNNAEKTINSYHKKGQKPFKPGNPGRPKGAKDKFSRTAKENIEEVLEKLGGWEWIYKWVNENKRNKALFLGWYFKMLPSNVDVDHSGEIDHNLFFNFGDNGNDKEDE